MNLDPIVYLLSESAEYGSEKPNTGTYFRFVDLIFSL